MLKVAFGLGPTSRSVNGCSVFRVMPMEDFLELLSPLCVFDTFGKACLLLSLWVSSSLFQCTQYASRVLFWLR